MSEEGGKEEGGGRGGLHGGRLDLKGGTGGRLDFAFRGCWSLVASTFIGFHLWQ